MALAIDASSPSPVLTGSNTVNTTASFSPPADSFFVLLIAGYGNSSDSIVASVSGGSLGWTRQVFKSINAGSTGGAGQIGSAEIWTAYSASAPGSMTVSITPNASAGAGWELNTKTMVLTGSEGATFTGLVGAASSASGIPTKTLVGVTAGSYVFAVSSDANYTDFGTVGTAQTLIFSTGGPSHAWRTTGTTSAGNRTVNLTAPPAQMYNICALEVKAATGGSGGGNVTAWLSA